MTPRAPEGGEPVFGRMTDFESSETDAARLERIIVDTRNGSLPMTDWDFAWMVDRLRTRPPEPPVTCSQSARSEAEGLRARVERVEQAVQSLVEHVHDMEVLRKVRMDDLAARALDTEGEPR